MLFVATKPSFPPGVGAGFGGGLSSLGGSKRDSFKFKPSTSSKEQLGTLVEEDEDEEAEDCVYERTPLSPEFDSSSVPRTASPVEMRITEPAPARHRPTSLNLRPLSLAASHGQPSICDLPTPEPSPGARPRPALRALTLSPSFSVDSAKDQEGASQKRHSMIVSSSTSSSFSFARRQSLNGSSFDGAARPVRRSSISYVSSSDPSPSPITGLPTPEMTPTSDRRYSNSSESTNSVSSLGSRSSRALSSSEHHFLYQAHAALVRRISDLEHALSARPAPRPQSFASEDVIPPEAPSDEMLQLVADLKAERDELKKDVDGWRARVSDSEHQVSMLVKRVEVERREAWVARERVGLIEIEKKSLEKTLAEKETWGEEGWKKYEDTQHELAKALEECQRLRQHAARFEELQAECYRMAAALAEERKLREEAERELDSLLTTPTPQALDGKYRTPPVSRTMVFAKRGGLGFRSIDSTGSFTDVESLEDASERPQFSLKSVEEEDEDDSRELSQSDCSDAEDELAGYEDEDDNDDYAFQTSLSNSSFGSEDGARDTSHLLDTSMENIEVPDLTSSRSTSSSPPPATPPQAHGRHASLSKAWTFPRNSQSAPLVQEKAEEIDRFFGCLEDVDNSPPLDSKLRSIESSKNLFSQALAEADDDFSPFLIPAEVGVVVPSPELKTGLDVVIEEEEEEELDVVIEDDDVSEIVGEEVEGGIIFTFTPPPGFDIPEEVPVSAPAPMPIPQPQSPDTDRSASFCKTSPSAIPRPALKSFVSAIPTPAMSTPPRSTSVQFPKSSGSPATFSSPMKSSSPPASSTPKKIQQASFIPQPRRSPMYSSPSKPMYSTPTKSQSKPRSSMYDCSSVVCVDNHAC